MSDIPQATNTFLRDGCMYLFKTKKNPLTRSVGLFRRIVGLFRRIVWGSFDIFEVPQVVEAFLRDGFMYLFKLALAIVETLQPHLLAAVSETCQKRRISHDTRRMKRDLCGMSKVTCVTCQKRRISHVTRDVYHI